MSNYELGAWGDGLGERSPGDPIKGFEVMSAIDGTYRIEVIGTGDGPAKFSLSTFSGRFENVLKEVDQTITAGESLKYEFNYSNTGESTVSEVSNFTPEASPSVEPEPVAGDPLTFDGSGSFDADGTVESYEWNFGDGETATGSDATHAYQKPGTYTITLKVTDDQGETDTSTAEVEVAPSETDTPTTTTTVSPEPNTNGWNKEDVTVNLKADDGEGGSGVEEITYSATGVHEIDETTVEEDSVQIPIAEEGETTITYFAKDKMDNTEEEKTFTVKLDKTEPTVASTTPADGTTGADPTTYLVAELADAMDPATITADTFTLAKQGETVPVEATVIYNEGSKKATLDPENDLDPRAVYTATIKGGSGGVKDLAGNPLATDKVWSFTTATRSTQQTTAAFGWGYNFYGQVGDGSKSDRYSPVRVKGPMDIKSVAAGDYHSLAVQNSGAVWTWGANYTAPVRVSGLTSAVEVAVGSGHSLALKSDGTVWAWGSNSHGQLGDGTTQNRGTPVQVSELAGVKAIAAGRSHSMALKNDGTVWAWGDNEEFQLGNGVRWPTSSPTPVQASGLNDIADIAAGGRHSLAAKNDGTVWAWGNNGFDGRLGTGSGELWNRTPAQVDGLSDAKAVSAGRDRSFAVKEDGTLWAWGLNSEGQLGDGTFQKRSAPVRVSGLTGVADVVTGGRHSLALKDDGTAWAWGNNFSGQLGAGGRRFDLLSSSVPVQVKDPNAPGGILTEAKQVAAGDGHSLAVKIVDAEPADSTAPETTIASGPEGPIEDSTPTFNFSGSDDKTAGDNLLFSYKLDDGGWSGYSKETSATLGGSNGLSDGSHIFYVRAKDEAGNEDASPAERSFTVEPPNEPPTADAGGPYEVEEGRSVEVEASGEEPEGKNLTYAWDLDNDGSFDDTSTQTATFDASNIDGPTNKTIGVEATDEKGAKATDEATVKVTNAAPTAVFSLPTTSVDEGDSFDLSLDEPSDASAADETEGFTYAFDCGDGNGYGGFGSQSTASCPTSDNGTLAVKGTVRDKDDGETEYTGSVDVSNVAPTVISISGLSLAQGGKTLSFTGSATDPSSVDTSAGFLWQWATDGGAFSSGSNPFSTSFSSCGDHTVSAKVEDKDGGESESVTSDTVSVYEMHFRQPLDEGVANTVQKGRVVPVKVYFACGTPPEKLAIQLLRGDRTDGSETGTDEVETYSVSAADTTGLMRSVDGGYIYNLQVPSNPMAGEMFTIRVGPSGDTSPSASIYALLKIK